ncbi:hypothetical protein BJX64DRAFT_270708 [Aspergillus heterothallicus]
MTSCSSSPCLFCFGLLESVPVSLHENRTAAGPVNFPRSDNRRPREPARTMVYTIEVYVTGGCSGSRGHQEQAWQIDVAFLSHSDKPASRNHSDNPGI